VTLVLVNSTRPIYSGKSLVECQIEFEVTCRTAVAIIGAQGRWAIVTAAASAPVRTALGDNAFAEVPSRSLALPSDGPIVEWIIMVAEGPAQ
jgi:hypothetical protein